MPIVLTDHTNSVWAVEQPDDGYIHVGKAGSAGPRLVDVLDFIGKKQAQFDKFVAKKRKEENAFKSGLQRARKRPLVSES